MKCEIQIFFQRPKPSIEGGSPDFTCEASLDLTRVLGPPFAIWDCHFQVGTQPYTKTAVFFRTEAKGLYMGLPPITPIALVHMLGLPQDCPACRGSRKAPLRRPREHPHTTHRNTAAHVDAHPPPTRQPPPQTTRGLVFFFLCRLVAVFVPAVKHGPPFFAPGRHTCPTPAVPVETAAAQPPMKIDGRAISK